MSISMVSRRAAALWLAALPVVAMAADPGFVLQDEWTRLQLAPKEAGAPANEHPANLSPEAVGRVLGAVRVKVDAREEPLFARAEIENLQPEIAAVLRRATPEQDLLLQSGWRRGMAGPLSPRLGVTARLFVQGGRLQLIVHDARLGGLSASAGVGTAASAVFGSRQRASSVQLSAPGAQQPRPDWLALDLSAAQAAAAAPAATGGGAAAPAPAPRAADPEERLSTLKRLREKGLITEEEYQQKRREILQAL